MEAQRAADQEQGQLQQTLQEAIRMIGQLSAQVNSQQAQLSELTQQEAARRRISDVSDLSGILPTRQLLEQQQVAGQQATSSVIDTRTLGKPETFKGDPNEYADWSFVLKAYVACVNHKFVDLVKRVEESRVPMLNYALSEGDRALSTQLYYILVMLVKGRALDVVQNTGPGEGAESLRRLEELYHPRIASRFVGTLSLILNTRFSGHDLESELELFEKTIRRYEQESGKSIDDQMLAGIIINGIQDNSIRDHVIRNSSRLNTYQAIRNELLEMARTNRVLSQMPTPMDIGAVPWKGGKGKGKNQKGDPKGGKTKEGKGNKGNNPPPGTGKGKGTKGQSDNPNKDKECRYCHKLGHIRADCRKRIADEKAKANKGSGKSRTQAAAPAPDQEPEPLSASPILIAGAATIGGSGVSGLCGSTPQDNFGNFTHEVLVDSGAGGNLFVTGFDPNAIEINGLDRNKLVTVTGEPLSTGKQKRSIVSTPAGDFSLEYTESEHVQFSVLSAGRAADRGTWTVIGPGEQCLVLNKDSSELRRVLKETPSIKLNKKRGVYWLPVKPAGGTAVSAGGPAKPIAAARPAKKAVPASMFGDEGEEAQSNPVDGDVEVVAESTSASSSQPRVASQEVPVEESEDPRKPRAKRIPDCVSVEEYNSHMLTHLPYRNWCDHCVSGKLREDPHFRRKKGSELEIPKVSMDYCYLGRVLDKTKAQEHTLKEFQSPTEADGEGEGVMPVLVIIDESTGCTFASVVAKGVNEHAVHTVLEALRFCGRQRVILQTDAEHSIRALAEAAGQKWNKEVQIQTAPRESHASNGNAERAIQEIGKQVRTVVNALEMRYPDFKVTVNHASYAWAVRHSAWLITRFLIKTDGKTPYERLRGQEYKGEVVEPFEVVHYKLQGDKKGKLDAQSAIGVWIGKSLNSDEHYLGTPDGIRRCRSIWRRPEKKRWDRAVLDKMKGSPWQPRGLPTVMPKTLGGVSAPGTPGGRPKGVYITLDRQIRNGT